MMRYFFGIDIGGTTVKTGIFSAEGVLLEKSEIYREIYEQQTNGGELDE